MAVYYKQKGHKTGLLCNLGRLAYNDHQYSIQTQSPVCIRPRYNTSCVWPLASTYSNCGITKLTTSQCLIINALPKTGHVVKQMYWH